MGRVVEVQHPMRLVRGPWGSPCPIGYVRTAPPFAVLDCGHRVNLSEDELKDPRTWFEPDVRCLECERAALQLQGAPRVAVAMRDVGQTIAPPAE